MNALVVAPFWRAFTRPLRELGELKVLVALIARHGRANGQRKLAGTSPVSG